MKKLILFFCLLFFSSVSIQAAIIHNDLAPDSLVEMIVDPTFGTGSGSSLSALDLNGDATDDFNFRYNVSPGFGWFMHVVEQGDNQIIRTTGVSPSISNPYVSVLANGDFIGSGSNWSSGDEPLIGDNSDNNFANLGDQYIGVKLDISGAIHYGWILVSFDTVVSPSALTIKEYAYNDVADLPISAGQTTGPAPIPEVEVNNAGSDIMDNAFFDFGIVNVGGFSDEIFWVKNTGTTDLIVGNVNITGLNTADFTVIDDLNTTIVPNDSSSFTLRFAPNTNGNRTAEADFSTNDADENPFNIVLQGNGGNGTGNSDFVVRRNNVVYEEFINFYDFGTVTVGNSVTADFYIVNLSTTDFLEIDAVDLNAFGSNTGITTTVSGPLFISPGDSAVLPITYQPVINGQHQAEITIFYDSFFNAYSFFVEGEATGGSDPGELQVWSGNVQIAYGGLYDFGNVPINTPTTEIFQLKNTSTTDVLVDFFDIFDGAGPANSFSSTLTTPFIIPASGLIDLPITFSPSIPSSYDAFVVGAPESNSGVDGILFDVYGQGVIPVLAQSIDVYGQGGATTISTNGGTLQMIADILPSNITNTDVVWSVDDPTIGTISAMGVLTAVSDGIVLVTATTTDGTDLSDTESIVISNQSVDVNQISNDFLVIYPNPTVDILNLKHDTDIEIVSLTIYNTIGERVKQYEEFAKVLNIGGLAKGIYYLQGYTTEDKFFTHKFIIE